MALTTNDALLEAWAEQIETMEQNLESLYGPPGSTPALPSVTTEDGMFEIAAEQTELSAWNFAKMYNYLTTEINTTRIVDVPDTALYYGQITKIGGQTIAETGELLSAEVASVISKDGRGNTLQTYLIPAEVQALEGYGWSAGTAYNYIDVENKKFVQNVGSVDLGSLSWTYGTYSGVNYFRGVINDKKDGVCGGICPRYIVSTTSGVASISEGGIAFSNSTSAKKWVYVVDSAYTDTDTFKTAMGGTLLLYELQTPIETDISAYLSDADVKVVAGGALTFDNSNNLDVATEVKYIA